MKPIALVRPVVLASFPGPCFIQLHVAKKKQGPGDEATVHVVYQFQSLLLLQKTMHNQDLFCNYTSICMFA